MNKFKTSKKALTGFSLLLISTLLMSSCGSKGNKEDEKEQSSTNIPLDTIIKNGSFETDPSSGNFIVEDLQNGYYKVCEKIYNSEKEYLSEEGEIKLNNRVGKWVEYNSDGKIRTTGTYLLSDTKINDTIWRHNMENDEIEPDVINRYKSFYHGVVEDFSYYDDKIVKDVRNFEKGKKVGKQIHHDQYGRLEVIFNYKNDWEFNMIKYEYDSNSEGYCFGEMVYGPNMSVDTVYTDYLENGESIAIAVPVEGPEELKQGEWKYFKEGSEEPTIVIYDKGKVVGTK